MTDNTNFTYEKVKKITDFLRTKTGIEPTIGIICGSGLGGLAELVENKYVIDYADIPGFPISTVIGHAGRLVFGNLGSKKVVCMQGRFHAYEGHSMAKVTLPVRVMKLLGIDTLIVTNACGGLNENYKVGDVMIIKDHICLPALAGIGPLVGLNDDEFGTRFTALSDAYDKDLRKLAKEVAAELGVDKFLHEGVYAMQLGPFYETIAECKLIRNLGADVVGMSTAPEVMVARHCGLRCFGLSLVTNEAIFDYDTERKANHVEVLETAANRGAQMCEFVSKICTRI
ncbi:DgyrCDS7267 [Dimorphilus gyrociliatus]|uniref:Purine nucleoside phosphorylase n=1 Tax=Dimorphilus gyrociliatus TaxID=2664684 RepID=A0A7I8VS81_9ANNE|nr:DgyrCDS7267 [Dimorphilus gyrociliatus]